MNLTTVADFILAHPFIWQSTLWLAIGLIVSRLFARRPAHAHTTLLAALGGAVVSPIISMCSGSLGIALLPQRTVVLAPDLAQFSSALLSPWYYSTDTLLLLMGCMAAVFWSARFARSVVLARRVLRDSVPVRDTGAINALRTANSMHHDVVLREHNDIKTPSIWCWSRPAVILLPPHVPRDLDSDTLASVFRHELAHLIRQDHLKSVLAGFLAAMIAWNPLAWYVRRRLRHTSEYACDAAAAPSIRARTSYAETLLQLAVSARSGFGLPVVSCNDGLSTRIRLILSGREAPARVGRTYSGFVVICCLAVVILLAPLQRAKGIEFQLPDDFHASRFVTDNSARIGNDFDESVERLNLDGENVFVRRLSESEQLTVARPDGHAIFISDASERPSDIDPSELLSDSPQPVWIEKE